MRFRYSVPASRGWGYNHDGRWVGRGGHGVGIESLSPSGRWYDVEPYALTTDRICWYSACDKLTWLTSLHANHYLLTPAWLLPECEQPERLLLEPAEAEMSSLEQE